MRRSIVTALGITAAGLVGCIPQYDPGRLNAPPQGESDAKPEWANYYTYHNDQGMLADMSIADIHFVPHTARLSGVGEARLERYAELLAETGGAIQYDTSAGDKPLVEARLASVRSFLAQVMPGNTDITVAVGLPGGRGMSAHEAADGAAIAKQAEKRQRAYQLNEIVTGVGGP